jgi:hypothetical protein
MLNLIIHWGQSYMEIIKWSQNDYFTRSKVLRIVEFWQKTHQSLRVFTVWVEKQEIIEQ